ncbi:restriction endonuclease subunit S [Streptomyces sp. NPDC057239]|uniref:restriction endonuclease subunit S n=1 Tax=Streptomyces sp. NPDC057239 TaxID=3346061 RepID=UPI00363A36B3
MSAKSEVRWVPVGKVGEVRMGKQLSPASSRESNSHAPYLRVANVFDGWIDYSDVKSMRFDSTDREKYSLKPGDILLNEGQSLELVGRSAIYRGEVGEYCFQNTLIRFRGGQCVIPEYAQMVFSRWLNDGTFASIAKKTTSIAHLGGDRFAKLLFPLIPLSRQRRIVEIVESLVESERHTEAAAAKIRTLRGAVVDSALSDLAWSVPLKDAMSEPIRNGFSPVEADSWTGVQMLGLGCLTAEGFRAIHLKNAPASVTVGNKAVLRDGDLLFSRANTRELVGLCGIYRDVGTLCIYPDLMMRLRPVEGVSSEYLEQVLRSTRFRMGVRAMAQGTSDSMVKISSAALGGAMVPVPDFSVQRRIVDILRAFDSRILASGQEVCKIRQVRNGLVGSLIQ